MKPNPYLYKLLRQIKSPCITETTADGTMYIGDCLPSCKGFGEKKWLIRIVTKDSETGLQRIFNANGSDAYDQAWTDRASIQYKPTPYYDETIEPIEPGYDNALATKDNTPIVTKDNQFIIVQI